MAKITYADKQQAQALAIPVEKQWRFEDANEVKESVNFLYEKFEWGIDFLERQILDTFSTFDTFTIDSINNISGNPTITITVDTNPYTLGDNIMQGQALRILVDIPCVINLNCTQL